ncbi:hypothetical protein SteCoe_33332 [Stentor coeruleus]|uniref:RING-type domain-containing protein n=1 Tax=Stentor coeruleus TaxID=5963 RepID=A0A1R2AWZ8_9CILI|nr:hypothetical protein SteCoe_33332 [Stentor coeruleus]
MLTFLSLLPLCLSKLSIVSPDILANSSIPYIITTFSNAHLYPIYGKFVFIEIDSSCDFSSDQKSLLNKTTIPIVSKVDNNNCSFIIISNIVEQTGSPGVIIVSDNISYYYNNKNGDFVNDNKDDLYHSYYTFAVCLIISSETFKIFEDYIQEQIWAIYVYSEYKMTKYPSFKFYMASDYDKDSDYIYNTKEVTFEYGMKKSNFEIIFSYIEQGNMLDENCLNSTDNALYCLPPSEYSTGRERILNTILSLNAFNIFEDNEIYNFFAYMMDLYYKCYYDRSVYCHELILAGFGITPNYNDSVLLSQGKIDSVIFPQISINDVYLYNPKYIWDLYILSSNDPYIASYECDAGCTVMNLFENACNPNCNTERCSYNFLNCLKQNSCYTFILGDGNCNSLCQNDPDCMTENSSNNRNDKILLIEILVPILGFFLIAIILAVVIIIAYRKNKIGKKKEKLELANDLSISKLKNKDINLKFTTFSTNLVYSGDLVCTLDLMAIHEGQDIAIFQNQCKHMFHSGCMARWLSEHVIANECPTCNIMNK